VVDRPVGARPRCGLDGLGQLNTRPGLTDSYQATKKRAWTGLIGRPAWPDRRTDSFVWVTGVQSVRLSGHQAKQAAYQATSVIRP
jgi:hypothetical protein